MKILDKHIKEMRSLGDFLMPYSFPRIDEEGLIGDLKLREIPVDGYNLILNFSRNNYSTHYLETLQIFGKYSPFLPFSLVCKVGKMFMGDQHLALVELCRYTGTVRHCGVHCSSDFRRCEGCRGRLQGARRRCRTS